ncbi:16087_t:CDS:1, partial [Acaulospora colombiana]
MNGQNSYRSFPINAPKEFRQVLLTESGSNHDEQRHLFLPYKSK